MWLAPATGWTQPSSTSATSVDAPRTEANPSSSVVSDLEALTTRLAGSEGQGHSEEQRQRMAALMQQAQEQLTAADSLRKSATTFRAEQEALTALRDQLAAEIAAAAAASDAAPDPDATIATLEAEFVEQRQRLTQRTVDFEAWQTKQQERPARRQALRDQLLSVPQQLAALQSQLQSPAGETPLLIEAARLEARARKFKLEQSPEALQAELAFHDAHEALDIARLKRDLFDRQLARHKREVTAWETVVQSKRQDAIARRIDMATTAATQSPEPLSELYLQNLAIARDERHTRTKLSEIEIQQQDTARDIVELQKRFDQLRERDRKAAGSTALGLRLRQQRELLFDPDGLRQAVESRLSVVEQVRLAALDRNDQLESLGQIESTIDEYLAMHPAPLTVADREWRQSISDAYEQRKQFLTELVRAYEAYADALDNLESSQESLASLTESMLTFIDERVLWIRSHHAGSPTGLLEEKSTWLWLVRGEFLREPWRVLKADTWYRPGWYVLLACATVTLQCRRRRQRARLEVLARQTTARANFDITPTLQALAVTILLCALWPGTIWFFGFRLQASPEATTVTRTLGHGLVQIAVLVSILEFVRHFVRVDGLADAHFDWGERIRGRFMHWVRRLSLCGWPLVLLVAVLGAHGTDAGGDFGERLVFTVVLMLLSWALRDLLHPRSGVLVDWLARSPEGWLHRLQPAWALGIVLVPVALGGLTLFGYYYTAQRLTEKLVLSLALGMAMLVGRGILVRWLMLRHRRLAIEQARARRTVIAEAATASDESIARVVDTADKQASLSASSAQSQRLVNTSLAVLTAAAIWLVWADVLPALNHFNTTPVFKPMSTVQDAHQPPAWPTASVVVTAPAAEARSAPTDLRLGVNVGSVTWGDLIRSLAFVVLTVTAARNVPGLLEIVVLNRLPIDASVRYAIQTFARYGIVVLGLVIISNLLGLEWSKIQWLAAALTFGLAFGLQEIFANFISGLIILSEQPVRLGDVVTIDNISGVVSRIRMRSTTITDWDRKEYIVPNKEFITGKLLNWTLTDSMNRIVIPVGVSYDSDPHHVRAVLQDIAESHPEVLKDPAPSITFDAFGDSALNFKLRVFLPTLDKRLQTIHELHTAICLRFREAGIEIPYPQRDLNLRGLPETIAASLEKSARSAA